MGKNPLESYWRDYLVTLNGVSQLKLVNDTITSKAYQKNIKSDIKLRYESRVNILKSLLNAWGIVHSYLSFIAILILSWYAFVAIVSLTNLSWEAPLKLHDSPLNTTPVDFYPFINVMWINLIVFQTPDELGLQKK